MMDIKDFKVGDLVRCKCCELKGVIESFSTIDFKPVAMIKSEGTERLTATYINAMDHVKPEQENESRRAPVIDSVEFVAGKIEALKMLRDFIGVSPDQHSRINGTLENLAKVLEAAYMREKEDEAFGAFLDEAFGGESSLTFTIIVK